MIPPNTRGELSVVKARAGRGEVTGNSEGFVLKRVFLSLGAAKEIATCPNPVEHEYLAPEPKLT